MPAAHPIEFRRAAVDAYLAGEGGYLTLGKRFGVSGSTIRRWVEQFRSEGNLASRRRGAALAYDGDEQALLVSLVESGEFQTMDEFRRELGRRTGRLVCGPTMYRYFERLGIRWRRATDEPPQDRNRAGDEVDKVDEIALAQDERPAAKAPGDARTEAIPKNTWRYREVHRRVRPPGGYPTDVTDAEWARLQPIFDPPKRRGRPLIHPRRSVLNAMMYVLRTGAAWRMLPNDLPPWQTVYEAFRRWHREGRFERMHDELRKMWRERMGRAADPSAVAIDSQSKKTGKKGGLADTTAPRRSTGGRTTSSSTSTAT